MTEREQIEREIREVLARETQAVPLSNRLFRPDGLFSRLATTEAERRLTDLQRQEGAAFARAVRQTPAAQAEGGYLLKLEQASQATAG